MQLDAVKWCLTLHLGSIKHASGRTIHGNTHALQQKNRAFKADGIQDRMDDATGCEGNRGRRGGGGGNFTHFKGLTSCKEALSVYIYSEAHTPSQSKCAHKAGHVQDRMEHALGCGAEVGGEGGGGGILLWHRAKASPATRKLRVSAFMAMPTRWGRAVAFFRLTAYRKASPAVMEAGRAIRARSTGCLKLTAGRGRLLVTCTSMSLRLMSMKLTG